MKSSYLLPALIILTCSIAAAADDEPERFPVKQTTTKSQLFPSAGGVISYSTSEDKDLLPGNDAFGFFYKSTDEKRGICRLRIKVVCDYGLEILKEQKNTDVKIQFTNMLYKGKTDSEGTLDAIFRCDAFRQNDGVMVTVKKHMQSDKLSEFPKELRIPADDCK